MHVLGTPPAFVLSQDQTLHKRRLRVRRTMKCFKVFDLLIYNVDLLHSLFSFQRTNFHVAFNRRPL
ncbi:hypothetical protein BN871_CK_00030 [Paenibacillus sp. P22]|nr:hypothetical protein BN871_CK_00030 [Paenibacillus sp. P22]